MSDRVFSHVALSCRDPRTTERFYTEQFGFRRARVVPLGEEQIVFLKQGDVHLELFRAEGAAPTAPAGGDGPHHPGVRHVAFQVEDVDATLRAMGAAARVTLGPLSFDAFIPGWRTVWVADPDDNIIEISQGYTDEEASPGA